MSVTVFIPCYNAEFYVQEAIESILNQTYQNFQILVIDDCSTDNSVKIIESIKDNRITLVKNQVNKGIVGVLNQGFTLVDTNFMVRQDADDLSVPDRLMKLLGFMEENIEVDVCGSAYKTFPVEKQVCHEENHINICAKLLNHTSITHGSAIFRMLKIKKYECKYSEEFVYAEDFHFFTKYQSVLKYANLPELLYNYRLHSSQISDEKASLQTKCHNKALQLYLKNNFGVNLIVEKVSAFFRPEVSLIQASDIYNLKSSYNQVLKHSKNRALRKVLRNNLKRIIRHSKIDLLSKFRLTIFWTNI